MLDYVEQLFGFATTEGVDSLSCGAPPPTFEAEYVRVEAVFS
jgi:hypothetical protein